jgi:hypothetical protein
LLWYDSWTGQPWHQNYPELFSYARKRLISVSAAVSTPLVQELFFLPLSNEAYIQFQQISAILESLQLEHDTDIWSFT